MLYSYFQYNVKKNVYRMTIGATRHVVHLSKKCTRWILYIGLDTNISKMHWKLPNPVLEATRNWSAKVAISNGWYYSGANVIIILLYYL